MDLVQLKKRLKVEFSGKRRLVLFVMLLCVVGVWNAFKFGMASLDYYVVRNEISRWQQTGSVQTEEDFLRAKRAIEAAQAKHHSHPLYADLAGQIEEWGVVAGYSDESQLKAAKSHYLRATELRPAWPVTWASLALIKWRMQEFDDELLGFLNNADRFGKQTPEVHILFLELGLALYNANHPFYIQIREQVQERLIKAMENTQSRTRAREIIKNAQAHETVCNWSRPLDEKVYMILLKCDED
uniref:VpsP family polysaccharide biosynthesis protein n=1 Tax=Ningiella ruwaisensis TaxID=2364274 RepID=UPI00109F08A9|nr:VpsP family polysaccharide biosynthesis protein [Ningiella ruwaisensis]